jgi:hypothetical protein
LADDEVETTEAFLEQPLDTDEEDLAEEDEVVITDEV